VAEPWREAGFSTPYAYNKARGESRQWSDRHSRSDQSKYDGKGQHRSPDMFRSYYNAYVSPVSGSRAVRARGNRTMPALRKYLVEDSRQVSASDYDDKYYVPRHE
jgi:hypothetical protein